MIDFSRIGNNLLLIGILAGFGYVIYLKMKGEGGLDKLKEKLSGMVSKGNEFKRGKI